MGFGILNNRDGDIENMDRRVLVGVGLLAVVVAVGFVAFGVLAPADGEPTYAPDRVAGYNQTENVTGDRAREIISRLHRQPSNVAGFEKAIVARYGSDSDGGIVLYVSVYDESKPAADNISRMVGKIRQAPGFDVNETTVGDTTVYTAKRDDATFAFFSYRETAYWVTHPRSLETPTTAIVGEVIEKNRQSRQRFPWMPTGSVIIKY